MTDYKKQFENAKHNFVKKYIEIEFNATEDNLFERMTLARLQQFSDINFGTHLDKDTFNECEEARDFFKTGGSEEEWRKKIRDKRIKTYLKDV